jgi:hypothetical protein
LDRRVMKFRLAPLFALSLCVAGPAFAQSNMETNLTKGPSVQGKPDLPAPKQPVAPGLPGAVGNQDRGGAAPKGATDLAPNDALFDAIARGDIASARDAIKRGADFNARNILGLTPVDESIDLGRNDITFLLLSLRGSQPEPVAAPTAKSGAHPTRPVVQEAAKAPTPAPVAPRPAAPAPVPRPVAQVQQPPRSGDTGTPSPQNGFLGFGG